MKIKSGFVLEEVGNSYIAVAVGERADSFLGLVKLNKTGAFFWNLMAERDMSVDELVDEAMKVFEGASRDEITSGVLSLTKTLRDGGLLE